MLDIPTLESYDYKETLPLSGEHVDKYRVIVPKKYIKIGKAYIGLRKIGLYT